MNKINILYKFLPVLVLGLAMSCSVNEKDSLVPDAVDDAATIVNSPEGAIAGELIIKFRPELSDLLDKACLTKSGAGERKLARLGINTVDDLMEIIGGYEFERIFPVDPRSEELTRKEGLHLWYIVRFDENTDVIEAARKLASLGELSKVEYNKEIMRNNSAKAVPFSPAAAASSVFNDPGLAWQWGYINTGSIPDEELRNLEAGDDVNCADAWKLCGGDPSIIVAVMDEGVMWSHPDLQANIWTNEDEIYKSAEDNDGNGYAGDVHGYNFVSDSGVITWSDINDTGHGTHVAGTIAAVNNNGEGVCGIAGGTGNNDGVKIMSLQIFSGDRGVSNANEV
ncbi:MAG: S8 family peptidase, partial [Candidatus Cryptobacteroides sp.]